MAHATRSSCSSVDLTPTSSLASSTHATSPPPSNEQIPTIKQDSLSRQERFSRWRPSYHVMAASGWMNDPCAPGYDAKTGLYHISYQMNCKSGVDWGDIAWGSATSPDMINWTYREQPCLTPDRTYDDKGVFTGCMINARDGSLTYAYTSVNHLPVHHTLKHVRGSESLSLAKSFDGGESWQKIDANPILPCEPTDLEVTGWRDPYVSSWPQMARFLRLDETETLFGIVSGGIRSVCPTSFLYAIPANDLRRWNYLGPIANLGLNYRPSRWSGDLGVNWEVTNFTTLRDEEDEIEWNVLVMGTEGCLPTSSSPAVESTGPTRLARGQLWMAGSLQRPDPAKPFAGPVEMTYDFGGHLDHGCLYAANSFYDPKLQKTVVWGWITEEDLCEELRHSQGWSGLLSMPRELSIQTLQHVVGASKSNISDITSIDRRPDDFGSYTLRTLSIKPYQPLVESLRQIPGVLRSDLRNQELTSGIFNVGFTSQQIKTSTWELDCTFTVSERTQYIGLSIDHTGTYSRSTTLFYDQFHETFTINRPPFPILNSSEFISSAPEMAPHTLFTMRDPISGRFAQEKLQIRAWRDNSVLEVFVNGRTAISTRLYAAEETFGLRFFADDKVDCMGDVPSELVCATLWDGIGGSRNVASAVVDGKR